MVDADSGPAVSDEQILTAFVELDESPLYAWEVAEELPVGTEEVDDELLDLEERGLLESDEDYAPGTVWRLPDDVDPADAGGESAEGTATDLEAQATDTGTQGPPLDQETPESPPAEPGEEPSNPPYELPTDVIETFDPPGMPEQQDRRREALRHAYGYLREAGEADREELVDEVYPSYRGAYEEPDDGWWTEVVEPGFERLPGAERSGDDETWAFVGTGEGVALRE